MLRARRRQITIHTYELQRRARANYPKKRAEYPRSVIALWKQVMRDRVAATKALVDFRGARGEFHAHSNHSDGAGTVADLAYYKEASGLDFMFVTDHWGVTQKRECVRHQNVWWGQEPGTQHHHIGILGINRKFSPSGRLAEDYERAAAAGGVPFIAHPAGWFPRTRYSDEQKASLDLLGPRFAMEIINGANQIFDCWDVTDEQSVVLWDQHLLRGKEVTVLGNTDAHLAEAIGDVWTAVLPDEFSVEGVLDALRRGRAFVSDGPIVDLTLQADGGPIAGMGQTLQSVSPAVTVRALAADSAGLSEVRLIRDGQVVTSWPVRDEQVLSRSFADTHAAGARYYRLECFARDGRRAYTNPVYVRPNGHEPGLV